LVLSLRVIMTALGRTTPSLVRTYWLYDRRSREKSAAEQQPRIAPALVTVKGSNGGNLVVS
jgi:hypothetical protein